MCAELDWTELRSGRCSHAHFEDVRRVVAVRDARWARRQPARDPPAARSQRPRAARAHRAGTILYYTIQCMCCTCTVRLHSSTPDASPTCRSPRPVQSRPVPLLSAHRYAYDLLMSCSSPPNCRLETRDALFADLILSKIWSRIIDRSAIDRSPSTTYSMRDERIPIDW